VKDDRLYLHHILERCHRITRFIGPGRETFMASEELQDAVIRNLEVIGEAAKRVSADGRQVWNVASSRIPEHKPVLEQFLEGERPAAPPGPGGAFRS